MDVKQKRSRKPRGSLPTLWLMVHRLTDHEWTQLKAFSQVYGKGSLQFRLLECLRFMAVYDPNKEKAAFPDNALGALRYAAKHWLIRTARRLAFYVTEVMEQTLDVDVLLRWGMHEEALEFIEVAKKRAEEEEEFGWMAMLLKQEKVVVKALYLGTERSIALRQIDEAAVANARLLVLEAEIGVNTTLYLEDARTKFVVSAQIDKEDQAHYFQTAFYKSEASSWPITFQIEKLRIDEFNYYMLGDLAAAVVAAETILDLCVIRPGIRPKVALEEAKCMFRLSTYYSAFADKKGNERILQAMQAKNPTSTQSRDYYLRRYLYILFHSAFDHQDLQIAADAVTLWEAQEEYLQAQAFDNIYVITLLFVCSYQIAVGEIEKATRIFGILNGIIASIPDLAFQAAYRVFHLIKLLEDRDVRGLESFGTNYKRYLKRHLPGAALALSLVSILCKPSNLDSKAELHASLQVLRDRLLALQHSDETTLNPFLFPMIEWATLRLRN